MFIADSVQPRLGLEKALMALLELLPRDQVELVLISGPPPENAAYAVTTLNQPRGWRGRLRALPALRAVATSRSQAGAAIVAAGSWAFGALAIATVFSKFRVTLWEHTLVPWRVRHELRSTIAAVAVRLFSFRLERVVAVSRSNATTVAPFVWPLKQLTVIPNVTAEITDSSDAAPHHFPEETRLIGIGSLTRRKNWELAIRAMRYLPESFSLDIAGDGTQREYLSNLIDELGLAGRVRLLGFVPDADSLISSADVVIHPSLGETFGYTMVEAAARQRPIVVSDMPVMNEMVPGYACGERAKPTPMEYAEAILRSTTTMYDYAGAATARATDFTDDVIVKSWATVVSGLRR